MNENVPDDEGIVPDDDPRDCERWSVVHAPSGKFVRKASYGYGGFALVDHPAQSTLYTTRKQAENRIERCQWIEQVPDSGHAVPEMRAVRVLLSYRILDEQAGD